MTSPPVATSADSFSGFGGWEPRPMIRRITARVSVAEGYGEGIECWFRAASARAGGVEDHDRQVEAFQGGVSLGPWRLRIAERCLLSTVRYGVRGVPTMMSVR